MNEVLLTAIAALGTVIAVLYQRHSVTFTRIEKKLDECERDRSRLWERLVKLETAR